MSNFKEDFLRHYRRNRNDNVSASQAKAIALFEARYGNDDERLTRIASRKRDIFANAYGYEGEQETILPNGWKLKVEIAYDSDAGSPWEDCDGMGVILECRDHPGKSYTGWILNDDLGWYRYFDWKATLPIAIKEGWDAKPYRTGTKQERAMRAMGSTYEYLRAWCNDEWHYIGVIVTLLDEDDNELAEESCWGFESCSMAYVTSEARSWAARMIRKARAAAREERRQEWIGSRWQDAQNLGIREAV